MRDEHLITQRKINPNHETSIFTEEEKSIAEPSQLTEVPSKRLRESAVWNKNI